MSLFKEERWDGNCKKGILFKNDQVNPSKNDPQNNEKIKGIKTNGIKKKKKVKKIKQITKTCLKKELSKNTIESPVKETNTNGNNNNKCEKLSKFGEKLRDALKGPRFRFINEQLYTSTGFDAKELFDKDPEAFKAYHEGYKNQVKQWPLNPLDRIISAIKKLPTSCIVADFGCGEGQLAQSVKQKVYSIDLISCRDDIIACDMANTPLKSQSIDVAVYCLSLMGKNLISFILEANRVLRTSGIVHIAETASRFNGLDKFIKTMNLTGFELVHKDTKHKLFYFFVFKKIKNVDKNDIKFDFSLDSCKYKKR